MSWYLKQNTSDRGGAAGFAARRPPARRAGLSEGTAMADLSIEDRLPPFYEPLKSRAAVDALFETPAFDYSPETSRAFCAAMRAALSFQGARAPVLKALFRAESFDPASVRTERDIISIPFVFVAALKERDLTTLAPSEIVLELRSSGTSGQRSRIQLDKGSLLRVRRMAWKVFEGLGLTDLERACPGVGPDMVRRVLRQMKASGAVRSLGRGPGARWRRVRTK